MKQSSTSTPDKVQTARARSAERMRRSRSRRSQGMRCFTLELRDTEINALMRRGSLAPNEQNSRHAIAKAMYAFLDDTLGR